MDKNHAADDLIGHFGQPQTLNLPDFEWVEDVVSPEPEIAAGVSSEHDRFIEVPLITRRGVGWVLTWASALAVIAFATAILIEFTYVLTAERALHVAARAGAMEATLPRATYQSVAATIERRLANYPSLAERLQLSLQQNGVLVQSQFRQHEGDQIMISLSAPRSAASPGWLQTWTKRQGDSTIHARAERQIPGRRLAYQTK